MIRIAKILIIIPVLYLFTMPALLFTRYNQSLCNDIVVHIEDSSDYHFVTRRQLANLAGSGAGPILGKPVKEIPVADIEDKINDLRELREVEVYMTIDGVLHVYADQRNPVMRIMPSGGGDFFLDEDGVIIRRRNLYSPRLHIVNGNVSVTQPMLDGISVFDTLIKKSILKDTYRFIKYINGNDFWAAQIDQIYVDSDNEIDLIPRVGNHVIHLGSYENFESKLNNLEAFYNKVLPEVGWNRYSVINLEFKDQIVCKKR